MATEAVSILISAEDKASAELAKTQAHLAKLDAVRKKEIETLTAERIAMEQGEEAAMAYRLQLQGLDEQTAKLIARQKAEVAQLKEVAKNQEKASPLKGTKATVEFAGSVASFAGASEIGSIASQIGGLTEKVSQFGEVSKAGGASAMLFKAGLVAAAGAIGFSIGNALGNLIFQTEKWTKEAEKATAKAGELQQAVMAMNRERFTDQKTDIELIRDPEEKKAAYQALLGDLKKNLVSVEQQTKKSEKEAKAWAEAWQITGNRKGFAQQAEMQAKNDRERLKALQDQAKEVERVLGIESEREQTRKQNTDQDYLESLSKQLGLLEAQQADGKAINESGKIRSQILQEEIKLLEARQYKMNFFAEQARQTAKAEENIELITNQLVEIEIKNKQIELEKELAAEQKKRFDDELASIQKLEQIERSQLDQIRLKTIEAEKGKQAREAEALVMQGLAESDAKRLAAEQAAADKRLEQQQAFAQGLDANRKARDQPLQAFMSRFMSRGPTEANKLEDLGKQQIKSLDQAVAYLRSLEIEAKKTKPTFKLGVDGI